MDKHGLPSVEKKSRSKWSNRIAIICGCLAPVFFPPIHIGILYYFWEDFSRSVDKHFCSCSCWDTVFKGTYETGVAAYKHLYFNATTNTFKIWVLTVVSMIALYECIRYLTLLAIQRQLRWSMLILFLSSVFAHYYSWWAYVNYWNDDYYSQWNHQLFFTLTELFSTIFVVHLAYSDNIVTNHKALGIIGVALIHVVAGGWDQFIENVVRGEGYSHQVLRDLGFMIPDILHVCLPLYELRRSRKERSRLRCTDVVGLVMFVSLGFLICSVL
ncbi:uncharacterized protein [Periplaneta americana]|uniref:uncharacterized protein n=1 Tax=Periplaneta americana TaxID=6978 RepID=UPI0037E7074D